MYNQMSMVSLEQPESMFNHTELALPVVGDTEACKTSSVTTQSSSSRRRRPQRGDLKQVVRAATMVNDASHVLLELDDVSIVEKKAFSWFCFFHIVSFCFSVSNRTESIVALHNASFKSQPAPAP